MHCCIHWYACIFNAKTPSTKSHFVSTFCDLDKVVSMLRMLNQSYWADMDTNNKLGPVLCFFFFFLCRWPGSPKQHLPSHSRQSSQGTKYFSSGCLTGCFFCFSKFQLILGRGFSTWAHGFVSTRGRCEKAQLRLVGCCVMWKPSISGGERVWEIWLSNIAKIAYKPLVCLNSI